MRAEHIDRLISVGRPTLARDGSFVVFATSRPDLPANRAVGQLWRSELPHGVAHRLTRGVADRAPRLSPDDRLVAFLRADDKGRAQIFVMAAGGGEPVQATDTPLGVEGFAWAPDAATLAFTARIPEPGRYGSVEGLDAPAESPRHITGIRWHANGLGYTADRPAQVFVVTSPDPAAEPAYPPAPRPGDTAPSPRTVIPAQPQRLTDDARSYGGVVFSADGTAIFATVDEIETHARDLRGRVVAIPAGGGTPQEVIGRAAALSPNDLAVADDGTLFVLAEEVTDAVDFIAPATTIWMLPPGGALQRMTDPDLDLGEGHLTVDGADVLVQRRIRGRNVLLRVTRDGAVTDVLHGDVEVAAHDSAAGRTVAAVATGESFGELAFVEDGAVRTLTAFGEAVREAGIIAPHELTLTGRDGYPVHGWVAAPAGEGPFPVILQIHGGPYASYGIHLFDETQVLVDAGYAVVYSNPRGSAGYGRAHGRSIRQAMGTVDMNDVLDFLDGAIAADPRLDGTRVGVQGGSYGGYLTAWIIAHDHRFAGAIVERGFLDPVSFQGTSDIGSFFGDEYVGTDAAAIAAQSPMAVVGDVRTPTFVVHSELDFRCPLEQATRYYAALKRGGVDAELLIFPGENHELSRAGQPRHRVERFAAILDWWRRHLPVAAS